MYSSNSVLNGGYQSDHAIAGRRAALQLLFIPILLELLAFIIIVWMTAFGHHPQSLTYLTSLAYLMLSVVWLPAYVIAFGVFWLKSKDNAEWLRWLNYYPIVVAGLIWFPITIITHVDLIELIKIYLLLAGGALLACALFIAVIRVILRYWKEV